MQQLDEAAQAAIILRGYRAARLDFGLNRIQLGAHLHLIKDHNLWAGLAKTWEEFLATENINSHAARQYITVAKKFVYELDLDEAMLRKLSTAGMSALEKAAKIITDENKDEMLSVLTALSDRDAIQRMVEMTTDVNEANAEANSEKTTFSVLRILKEYHQLPPELQQEFRIRLETQEQFRHKRNAQKPADAKELPAETLVTVNKQKMKFRSARPSKSTP